MFQPAFKLVRGRRGKDESDEREEIRHIVSLNIQRDVFSFHLQRLGQMPFDVGFDFSDAEFDIERVRLRQRSSGCDMNLPPTTKSSAVSDTCPPP